VVVRASHASSGQVLKGVQCSQEARGYRAWREHLLMDYSFLSLIPGAIQKPEPRSRTKGRKSRKEGAVKREVREQVAERDPSCRVEGMAPAVCRDRLEWAHLKPRTRAQTRNMPAEYRHTTMFTAMLCGHHHDLYDAGVFDIRFIDEERGADGPIEVIRR